MPRSVSNVPPLSNLRTQIHNVNGDRFTVVPLNQLALKPLWRNRRIEEIRVSKSTLGEMIEMERGAWRVSSKYLPVSSNNIPYLLSTKNEAIMRSDMALERGASLSLVSEFGDPPGILEWFRAGVSLCTDRSLGLFCDQVVERRKEEAENQQARSRALPTPHPERRPLMVLNTTEGPHSFVGSGDPRVEALSNTGIGDCWDVLSTVKTYCDPGYAPLQDGPQHTIECQYTTGASGYPITREQMDQAYANRYTSEEVAAWCRKNNRGVPGEGTSDEVGVQVKDNRENTFNAVMFSRRPLAFYTDSEGKSLAFSNPIVEDYQVLLDALGNSHYKQICGLMPPIWLNIRFNARTNVAAPRGTTPASGSGPDTQRQRPARGRFELDYMALNLSDELESQVEYGAFEVLEHLIEKLEEQFPSEVMAFADARAEGLVSYNSFAGLDYLFNTLAPAIGITRGMKVVIEEGIAGLGDSKVQDILRDLIRCTQPDQS